VWLEVAQGDAVVREGLIDDSLYIITAGEATVTKQGSTQHRMKVGDCFGEMAYLRNIKRTATVTAETPLSLMKLNASLLEQVAPACQLRFYKVFTAVLIDRLISTSEQLAQRT
jgi:CRP-like cAMP-binding protein